MQRSFDNDSDISNALTADQQGLGSGPDLLQGGEGTQNRRGELTPAQALTT